MGYFFIENRPVSDEENKVEFVIKSGTNKIKIIDSLKDADLIRSKYAAYAYVFIKSNINLQAGTYLIDRSSTMLEIIDQIKRGETGKVASTVRVTFKEGLNILEYAEIIDSSFPNLTKDAFLKVASDKEFLKELINKYWFLTDEIFDKDILYPLEGYLFPETYDFYENASARDIIIKLLNQTESKFESLKEDFENSDYTVHEILTKASICEMEAINYEDRQKISQVIDLRLKKNMSLGMDVTTYYAVGKNMHKKDVLTAKDLASTNPYNTRNVNVIGLMPSSICNSSIDSVKSALHPSDTSYLYFVADVTTGKVYFASNETEFYSLVKKYINK